VAYFSGYDLLSFIDDFVVHQLNAAGDDDLNLHHTPIHKIFLFLLEVLIHTGYSINFSFIKIAHIKMSDVRCLVNQMSFGILIGIAVIILSHIISLHRLFN